MFYNYEINVILPQNEKGRIQESREENTPLPGGGGF